MESDMRNDPLHKQSAAKRFVYMHILNSNVIVVQWTVTKKPFFEALSLHRVRKALSSATLKRSH